ncbi:hypothetical protein K2173_017344 [Erythroxylum novogranatense]|uniref:Myb-related protein 123 n=1 Tax=Erythroxylum novogranatense TaxID=1862640 RepID=A0AAV8TM12_9ROSI|nr:hypothetical protein K2173_017344 [Erythroxylum novogranatense]
MGRSPCCSKEGLNRGAWTALEDKILTAYIKAHGEGKWRNLPKRAGLKRCGKSCRLRWLNYLRPDIKRGNISNDEEELIIRLHKLLGNRWSLIAGRLPGRTDNEIKNYWNTTLVKKANAQSASLQSKIKSPTKCRPITTEPTTVDQSSPTASRVIRTKATRCTKVMIALESPPPLELQVPTTNQLQVSDLSPAFCSGDDGQELHNLEQDASQFFNFNFQASNGSELQVDYDEYNQDLGIPVHSTTLEEPMFKEWNTDSILEGNATLDLEAITSLLDSAEWP